MKVVELQVLSEDFVHYLVLSALGDSLVLLVVKSAENLLSQLSSYSVENPVAFQVGFKDVFEFFYAAHYIIKKAKEIYKYFFSYI